MTLPTQPPEAGRRTDRGRGGRRFGSRGLRERARARALVPAARPRLDGVAARFGVDVCAVAGDDGGGGDAEKGNDEEEEVVEEVAAGALWGRVGVSNTSTLPYL